MKKTMFLALAVLGMFLANMAVVQPTRAQSQDCPAYEDPYGCDIAECGNCVYWSCIGQGDIIMEFCAE